MATESRGLGEAFDRFDAAVREFVTLAGAAPDVAAPPSSPWGARELAAHMVFWHTAVWQSLEELAAGRHSPHPGSDFDDINARAVIMNQGRPLADMLGELLALQDRIRDSVQVQTDPDAVVVTRPDGTPVTVVQWINIFHDHCRGHVDEMKEKNT